MIFEFTFKSDVRMTYGPRPEDNLPDVISSVLSAGGCGVNTHYETLENDGTYSYKVVLLGNAVMAALYEDNPALFEKTMIGKCVEYYRIRDVEFVGRRDE